MDRREATGKLEWLRLKCANKEVYSDLAAALDLAIEALNESINKVQQADTLIIAAALQNFAQDSERNISDRERAKELRKQILACGAIMCKPVTPTERTGEWVSHELWDMPWFTCSECNYHGRSDFKFCPNCGAKMNKGGDTE